jgi:hypothetical protein
MVKRSRCPALSEAFTLVNIDFEGLVLTHPIKTIIGKAITKGILSRLSFVLGKKNYSFWNHNVNAVWTVIVALLL